MFVDTDLVPALDSRIGSLVQNETEAKLVYQVCTNNRDVLQKQS